VTIPAHPRNSQHQLATPPQSPEETNSDNRANKHVGKRDALDFLLTIFPSEGISLLPFARSIAITIPNLNAAFDGAVVDFPGKPRTLYVDGKSAAVVSLRERFDVSLLFVSRV
jgi:hypothetical protein